ncbi:Uncharacterised protein [Klebsiella pneumoniae]|nr:Uncharacterised protein [Klebsiella pneumoniae]
MQHFRVRAHWRCRVAELHAFQSDTAAQVRVGHVLLLFITIDRHRHQLVQRTQRGFSLLVTRCQANHLAQRCRCTPGQHNGTDQRTHGQGSGINQVDANHNQHHRLELLQEGHSTGRQGGEAFGFRRTACLQGAEVLPAALHIGLAVDRFQRLHTFNRLNQHALLQRGFLQVGLHDLRQRPLDNHADNQN